MYCGGVFHMIFPLISWLLIDDRRCSLCSKSHLEIAFATSPLTRHTKRLCTPKPEFHFPGCTRAATILAASQRTMRHSLERHSPAAEHF
jgi:hypothetical protein